MKRALGTVALMLGLGALSGCTSLEIGKPIDDSKVAEILPGRTTVDEVEGWFGKPEPGHLVKSEDGDIYVYRYLDGQGKCDELVISFSDNVVSSFSKQ
jgi:hypothetical protein